MNKAVVATKGTKTFFTGLVFVLLFSFGAFAQKKKTAPRPTPKPTPNANLPKVTQINEVSIKTALKPNGKPLLVNFWATWCIPCVEEFPDLVKLDAEYKGKIDLITISLDDLAEINRDVPKFLLDMKAEMPAYLLRTPDENAVITSITKDWQGGLPFTILYNEKGEIAYFVQGKFKPDLMRAEINKLLSKPAEPTNTSSNNYQDPLLFRESTPDFEKGQSDARKDASQGIFIIRTNGLSRKGFFRSLLREKYGILTENSGCLVNDKIYSYNQGYNEISKVEIKKRFGEDIFDKTEKEAAEFEKAGVADVTEIVLNVNRKP